MTAPVRPEPPKRFNQLNVARQRLIQRNLRILQEKGASDAEIESYLRDDEGLAPMDAAPDQPDTPTLTGTQSAAGRLMAVAQGGMGNLADEAAGALHAVTHLGNDRSFGENYREGRDAVRSLNERFHQEHPKEDIALNLVGGIAPATTLPVLKNLGAVKGGAAYGALYGAGGAEGDLGDRLIGAGVGAGAGAAGGALLRYGVAPLAGRVVAKAKPVVGPLIAKAAPVVEKGATAIENFLTQPPGLSTRDVSGASLPPNATRARGTLTQSVLERVQAAKAQAARLADAYAPPTQRERAQSVLLKNLSRDKVTPRAAAFAAKAEPVERPTSVLELGGRNTQGAARGAVGVPSEAKRVIPERLNARQEGELGRARDAIEAAAGVKPEEAALLSEELGGQTRAAATPAYRAAYAEEPIADPEALAIFRDPAAPRIYKSAARQAEREGVTLPPLQDVIDGTAAMPVQGFDYFKRGMDDFIEGQMRRGKIGKNEARQLRDRLAAALTRADEIRPTYATARATFRGGKEVEDAAALGSDFLRTDDREVARLVQGMTPAQREAYTKTALDAIVHEIRSTGDTHDVYTRIFGNPLKRDALKALVGDEGFARLDADMQGIKARTGTRRFITNQSATADKLAEQLDLETPGIPTAALQLFTGKPGQAAKSLSTSILVNRLKGITQGTADELAQMTTAGMQGGRQGRLELLKMLRELVRAEQEQARRAATRESIVPFTRPVSGAAGGAVSPRREP